MASKLLDNVTFNNSHTTCNNSTNRAPFSNKDSSQVPLNKSLKNFHQNIRGLGNKSNESKVIFADDTNILFAHSNLIDINKNIHIVFVTSNKWCRANQLSLNFNKTNYVHFTTKRKMSVNQKIGFNNIFITNSSYTKFLGVTMDNNLSWNNHIDLLMEKLSTACYIIRNAKTYVSASSVKMLYQFFFY
jgi:hypothetical protein